ncbi:MAG TPA: hypothetical protein VN253_09260 [Kofleriaceae bacterium]|nr:hypothetical protein [Kofleriaceae bacterium]
MSQQHLEHSHRLLTAVMISQVQSNQQPLSNDFGIAEDDLKLLRGLPLTGCHVDSSSQKLMISLSESEQPNATEHERHLRQVLGDIEFQIVYTTHRDHSAPSKTEAARPLWGGVQMATGGLDSGTLTLVVDKGGSTYTLVSAHVVGVGHTGQVVGQPRVAGGKYGVVTLNPAGPDRASDSALASIDQLGITGQRDRIWRAPDESYVVSAKARTSELTVGTRVYMQGAASSGLQAGRITATNVTSKRPSGLVLTGQIMANYTAIAGDSGAPVFLSGAQGEVTFAGIVVGTHDDEQLFSPWEGIQSDLGL